MKFWFLNTEKKKTTYRKARRVCFVQYGKDIIYLFCSFLEFASLFLCLYCKVFVKILLFCKHPSLTLSLWSVGLD